MRPEKMHLKLFWSELRNVSLWMDFIYCQLSMQERNSTQKQIGRNIVEHQCLKYGKYVVM